MKPRINIFEQGKDALKVIYGLGAYRSSIEKKLLDLINYRVSQINGCAVCLDIHSKDLRAEGETEQRLYLLDAWRDAPLFTNRERAALSWAEAVNKCDVPDEVYEEARKQFSEKEIIDLTVATITINSWNRLNISFKNVAGDYQPGQYANVDFN
ncbi:MAG: carboxymuconolactone decarboxylase family protein [Bacteroidetes bacterium]|nr:carboxymuconolactone decarboxylase family protein [Bacteroidota bacterium]